MRLSQLLHVMDKDESIVIDDYDKPIFKQTLYKGAVRGIKRDNPINKMHVSGICADDDVILVLVEQPRKKEQI